MQKKGKRTVLVVDDMELNRELISKIFTDRYLVYQAANGKEALDIMENIPVDIVVLDIQMPVMGGYEVITKMKSTPKLADIPIVVTTGALDQSERKAFALGADEYIAQPYDPYIISKRVDNLIEKYVLKIDLYKNMAHSANMENKAKTDFLSRISHDIRTPLNGILGLANLLKKDIDKRNYTALEDVEQIELSGYYLLNLLNDTLDVNKIESGKMTLNLSVCDGLSLFNNILLMIKPLVEAKKIKFLVETKNLPFHNIYVDVGRLEQITMNMLSNAVKFTPPGGTIRYGIADAVEKDGTIIYTMYVSDTGRGMSEEFLPHLFEAFAQENQSFTSHLEGTGLGMTITKELIELMGGHISVESELGQGTTFTYTLPLKLATEEQVKEWKATQVDFSYDCSLEGKRALLCEDNAVNALIANRLLEIKGVKVEKASNGKEGLKLFEKSPEGYYDFILMDVRMPVLDGIETTIAIRHLPREDAQRIPIVAMTANALETDVEQVKKAGMDAHIAKPISVEMLYKTLGEVLSLRKIIRKQVVLVVDDVEVNRAVIKESLLGEYVILEAANGEEALEILDKHPDINALITDLQMPKMSGVELVRKVRQDHKYRNLIIIANTQFGGPEQEEMLLELGVDDFVYKPTTPKIVEIRVRNVLKNNNRVYPK